MTQLALAIGLPGLALDLKHPEERPALLVEVLEFHEDGGDYFRGRPIEYLEPCGADWLHHSWGFRLFDTGDGCTAVLVADRDEALAQLMAYRLSGQFIPLQDKEVLK